MRRFLVISALIVLAACDATDDVRPEGESENGQFEATFIGVEDCNMALLEFKEEDVSAIQEITDIESSRYFAINLTKVLLDPGQKLNVVIRKVTLRRTFSLSNLRTNLPMFVSHFLPAQTIIFFTANPPYAPASPEAHIHKGTTRKHILLSFRMYQSYTQLVLQGTYLNT